MSLERKSDEVTQDRRDAEGGAQVLKKFPARPEVVRELTAAEPAQPKRPRRRIVLGGVALIALAAAGYFGHGYWTHGRFMVKTDDAYVQADIAEVSAKIQGYVAEIPVSENQHVAKGDILFRLDDGDYRIALATAESRITTQAETLKRIDAQTNAARAAVQQAEAEKLAAEAGARNADLTEERTRNLLAKNVATQAQLDDATAALDQAKARVSAASAQIASAEANVAVLQAQRDETASQRRDLQLAIDQAQRNLELTVLRAPYDGVVTNLSAELGDLVSPGGRLAAIVPVDGLYIEANYKETQLAELAPGAHVTMSFDALPGRSFEGSITSTAPATGAMFSLLPAENATGNFTKIVQRVPVRIDIPQAALDTGRLRAGLSAVVEVDSRTARTE